MTTFKQEARRRMMAVRVAADERRLLAKSLEQRIRQMFDRAMQEKEWLERSNLRIYLDDDWKPHFGLRICRNFNGGAPSAPYEDNLVCCSIWTGGDSIRYDFIEFVPSGPMYSGTVEFEEAAGDDEIWKTLVERVCERFDLGELDDAPGTAGVFK